MLEVDRIFKNYEGKPLLRGVSFNVGEGETVCLLGGSGSGKSTLLRIIAGLEQAEAGAVRWNGRDIAPVPVHRRAFGLMFQDYALFPHRDVAENVAFGLRMQGLPRAEIDRRVREALERVHMAAFARRRVTDLSGGEQQRVALARALAPRPRLLMLDEPLGALDRTLKEQLAAEVRQVLHETRIPAIYVTHDQEEAFTIADRLILLHNGLVEQAGAPEGVFNEPASAWVAQFFGLNNLLPGRLVSADPPRAETPLGVFESRASDHNGAAPGAAVTVLLRPRGAEIGAGGANEIRGVVEDCVFQGDGFRVRIRAGGTGAFDFVMGSPLREGEPVTLRLNQRSVQFIQGELNG